MSENRDDIDWSLTTWEGSRRAQLRHALTLTLRERMEAMEGLGDIARRFQDMRAQGKFKEASQLAEVSDSAAASAARESVAQYGSGSRRPLVLRGCTPEPLGNYLKALGVFRIVAEQADPQARAWWEGGVLRLHSKWSQKEITEFFLYGIGESKSPIYCPTPIFAPWGGRPGFYDDGNEAARERLKKLREACNTTPRLKMAVSAVEESAVRRRSARRSQWPSSSPRHRTVPEDGCKNKDATRRSEVLPAPLAPTITQRSSAWTWKLMFLRIVVSSMTRETSMRSNKQVMGRAEYGVRNSD